MKNLTTSIALLAIALSLLAGSTSCGGAAALADQLAQGSLAGSASDDGTIDQGPGNNGVVTPGSDDGTADQGRGDNGSGGAGADDPAGHDANDDHGGSR